MLIDDNKLNQPISILVDSIQSTIRSNYQLGKFDVSLTAIVGVASYPEHGDNNQLLLSRSAIALKAANNTPKKWANFELAYVNENKFLLQLAVDLKAAIATNAIELYHQPQIDLKTLKVCGSECLLRWHHESEGFIKPSLIISIAEDFGLINQLTLTIIDKALSQHQDIIDNGHTNHMLAINITAKDIATESFYHALVERIEQSSIPAEKVILELTESKLLLKNSQAIESLNLLTDYGFSISLDDFGTGFSSMASISSMPLSELKIDPQFVENITLSHKKKVISETITTMAKGLGIEVVAEGITNAEDEKSMKQMGCDIGQGYYYAKPMNILSYLIWLNEQKDDKLSVKVGDFIPASQAKKPETTKRQ